jgi:cytochrome d ubiquinol oxidase subunit I
MDPLILARIHFALATTFHFIFPAATIGLALLILLFQTLYLLKKEKIYDDFSFIN